MTAAEEQDRMSGQPHLPDLQVRLRTELGRIDEQVRALPDAMDRMRGLLDAMVAISREVKLPAVLHRIVTTAMEMIKRPYPWNPIRPLSDCLTVGTTGFEPATP
ncbi:hypothetical protein AB0D40_06015 [Streptomyces massasporeus]|uniref:hypothetical protein n=1 Tax=Streptomyces massasporeus TaxID=67324 RepID=UPI00340901D3